MDSQARGNRDDPFANPNHHHLLGPPLTHHMPSDHLKRPLPVNGHNNGLSKMPESPQGLHNNNPMLMHPSMAQPGANPSTTQQQANNSSATTNNTSDGNEQRSSIVEEYLQSQINRWRSNNLELTDLISELLTVMPPEDQMQFMTGIMDLIYKKRNNPEEEKQMRKYFLGGATSS